MKTQSIRLRVVFDDRSVLSQTQQANFMDHTWLLIEPNKHLKISDVSNRLLHVFNLHSSCPNGILLYMENFFLPPSESTQLLKDRDIICVKKNGLAIAEAAEVEDGSHLLANANNLLLANEEYDKETGAYESEFEEDEDEKLDEEPSKKPVSKKRKASTKIRSPKKKKKRSVVMDGVEYEVATKDGNMNHDECFRTKNISKKVKSKKKKNNGERETIIAEVKSSSKEKRKKKHRLMVESSAQDEVVTDEIGNVYNADGVKQESTAPDGAKKGPSRSARRKKAKRKWMRELAIVSQNTTTHLEPEDPEVAAEVLNKEANGHPYGLVKQDQLPAKFVDKNVMEPEQRNGNGNVKTKFVPCVVRPGHIRFEPLDEDEDAKRIEVPNVAFQWNGITSKKKGQKWGIEKFSTFLKNDSQKAENEPSTIITEDAQPPLIDLNNFDQLPMCSSPKEGDVIAYRLIELSSSWTPELSSFRVGKVSHCDGDNIVLNPVPEYPVVFDKIDEDGPHNSLYKEDGSLEINFEGLLDVRSVNQSNSDATTAVSNGVNRTDGENNTELKLLSIRNDNETNLSKDPSPVVTKNKEGDTWEELSEALRAKKQELLEINEEMKKDSGSNKWSYRALRGSALGPTMAMLRSTNNM
ncbi:coilin-like [Rutidosis leptorrhynchoides]|uniref:coilin-like n=1 Tax=Rutidosis leptorrhynchoides TaxID=125765 RepID=UPI003A9A5C8C